MSLRNILFLLIATFLFVSCESDKDRMKKGKEIVSAFLSNANVENNEVINELYPSFSRVGKYYKVADFKFTNTNISKDKTITITGKSSIGDILFVLKSFNGEYKIVRSKGLSPTFNSNLYYYCKAIGCITSEISDADVYNICSNKSVEFDQLVYNIKENIEDNFNILNHNLTMSGGYYGISSYIEGQITMRNNSRFTIPGFAYNLYYQFIDANNNVVFTKKEIGTYETIGFNQSKTARLFEDNAQNFDKVRVKLEITSTDFIEKIIIKNVKGNNCSNSANLL